MYVYGIGICSVYAIGRLWFVRRRCYGLCTLLLRTCSKRNKKSWPTLTQLCQSAESTEHTNTHRDARSLVAVGCFNADADADDDGDDGNDGNDGDGNRGWRKYISTMLWKRKLPLCWHGVVKLHRLYYSLHPFPNNRPDIVNILVLFHSVLARLCMFVAGAAWRLDGFVCIHGLFHPLSMQKEDFGSVYPIYTPQRGIGESIDLAYE